MLDFYSSFFKTMANIFFAESRIRKAHKIRLWHGDLRRFPVSTRAPSKLLDQCPKHCTKIYKVSRYQPVRLQNFQISVQNIAQRSAKFSDINPSAFKTFKSVPKALQEDLRRLSISTRASSKLSEQRLQHYNSHVIHT